MNRKTEKRLLIGLLIMVMLLSGGWLFESKSSKYQNAKKALEENRLSDAREAFVGLEDYEDSRLYVKYIDAQNETKSGNHEKAATAFRELGGFLDSEIRAGEAEERLKAARYARALEALSNANYQEAIPLLEKTAGYQDTAKYLMYAKAMRLGEMDSFETAIANFQTLGSFSDSELQAIYYHARDLEKQRKYEEAGDVYLTIAAFRDSQERISALPALISERELEEAQALADGGNLETAIDQLKQLVSEGYEPAEAALKDCYTKLGDTKDDDLAEAYRLYGLAENEEKRKELEDRYGSAIELFMNGQYEEAAHAFADMNTYADAQEMLLAAWYRKGETELENRQWDEAEATFAMLQDYKDAATKQLAARYGRANALAEAGEWKQAEEGFLSADGYRDSMTRAKEAAYRQGLALMASDEDAALVCFDRAGDYSDAVTYGKRIWYGRGVDALGKGEFAAARERFEKAGDYGDASLKLIEAWYKEGEYEERRGNLEMAAQAFLNASGYGDGYKRACAALYAYAEKQLAGGDWESATRSFHALEGEGYQDAAERRKEADLYGAYQALSAGAWATAKERFEALEEYQDAPQGAAYAEAQALLQVGADQAAYEKLKTISGYRDVDILLSSDRMQNLSTQAVSLEEGKVTLRLPKDWTAYTRDTPEAAFDGLDFNKTEFLAFLDSLDAELYAFGDTQEFTVTISDETGVLSVKDLAAQAGEGILVTAINSIYADYDAVMYGFDLMDIQGVSYIVSRGASEKENLAIALAVVAEKGYTYILHGSIETTSDAQLPQMHEILESAVYAESK